MSKPRVADAERRIAGIATPKPPKPEGGDVVSFKRRDGKVISFRRRKAVLKEAVNE